MKQSDVNFEVKRYSWTGSYQKDGEPTLYYEFNKSEYYALIAVKGGRGPFYKRAIQIYIEEVTGGESEGVEWYPKKISKSEAFLKFVLAEEHLNQTVQDVIDEFEKIENGLVLIDGNLI